MSKDASTEQRILDAARRVFYRKGLSGARMNEIAEEAGINQALLHYYFRSKQKLHDHILSEAFGRLATRVIGIMTTPLPPDEKVRQIVAFYHQLLREEPHLPMFVLNAVQQDPERFADFLVARFPPGMSPKDMLSQVGAGFRQQMQAGGWRDLDPKHVIINLISMSVFPFMMRPVLSKLFGLDDAAFEALVQEREELVADFVLRGMKRENME